MRAQEEPEVGPDCTFDGAEAPFGGSAAFSGGEKATFTDSLLLDGPHCFYLIIDTPSTMPHGGTLEFGIAAAGDVTTTGAQTMVSDGAIPGTTTIENAIYVSGSGQQVATLPINASSLYVGGALVLEVGTHAGLAEVTITASGTVDLSQLANVRLRHEPGGGPCAYGGDEEALGSPTTFDGLGHATFTGLVEMTDLCLYVVLDSGAGVTSGSTLEIGISAAQDVLTNGAEVFMTGDGSLPGTTTFQ